MDLGSILKVEMIKLADWLDVKGSREKSGIVPRFLVWQEESSEEGKTLEETSLGKKIWEFRVGYVKFKLYVWIQVEISTMYLRISWRYKRDLRAELWAGDIN